MELTKEILDAMAAVDVRTVDINTLTDQTLINICQKDVGILDF